MPARKNMILMIMAAMIIITVTVFPIMMEPNITVTLVQAITDREILFDLEAGYADEIQFKLIESEVEQVQALQSGEINIIGQLIDPNLTGDLENDVFIDLNVTETGIFYHISFNCNDAPFNWTTFRKAVALAFDKIKFKTEYLGEYGQVADSPIIPSTGRWSLDNHLEFTNDYYTANNVTGNAILDTAGFFDLDDDGWREDPNGNPIDIILYADKLDYDGRILETFSLHAVNAFDALHMKSDVEMARPMTIPEGCCAADWGIRNLGNTDPLFLEKLQSSNAENDWNFHNTTYDSLVNSMKESCNETEVYEACWQAQKILWEEQPLIVLAEPLSITAYRNEIWEGQVNVRGKGAFDWWSLLKTSLKKEVGTGTAFDNWKQGGRLTVSIAEALETTNPLQADINSFSPLDLVYDGLFSTHPYTHEDCAWLAYDWTVEEVEVGTTVHAQEGDVMKITYFMQDGLSWHDGTPLTASDVVFSCKLINSSYSDPDTSLLRDITHVKALDNTTVEIFTSRKGFFVPHDIAFRILPKHIWESIATPLTWENPSPVGSGPYKWTGQTPEGMVTLERNDDHFYNPRNYIWIYPHWETTTEESSTTTTTTTLISSSSIPASRTPSMLDEMVPGILLLISSGMLLVVLSTAGLIIGGLLGRALARYRRK